ncbi:MAG: LamG domain-containing protein [Candidatus Micrarchaeales archaeon]
MRATQRHRRAQSAMEYLVTYSWVILIVVVAFVALYAFGVFSPNNFAPRIQPGACSVYRPYGPWTVSLISLTGACSGGLPQYVTQFNGQSGYVTLPSNIPRTTILSNGMTFSAWIETTSSTLGPIVGQNTGTSCNYYCAGGLIINHVSNKASMEIYNNAVFVFASSSTTINNGQWYHIAGEYAAGNLVIYVNGVNQGSTNAGGVYTTSPINFLIGLQDSVAVPYYFNGLISNVQIYNTSLSANEIQALYIEGIGGVPLKLQNLVAWWPLNGDANDYSGNGNNGVPTNVVYTSSWISSYTSH